MLTSYTRIVVVGCNQYTYYEHISKVELTSFSEMGCEGERVKVASGVFDVGDWKNDFLWQESLEGDLQDKKSQQIKGDQKFLNSHTFEKWAYALPLEPLWALWLNSEYGA